MRHHFILEITIAGGLTASLPAFAQNDTLLLVDVLDEVVITTGTTAPKIRSAKGSLASIDEHLTQLQYVDAVRRGSYAWEPTINNMQTERISTTIDGMKIFSACTDRMDPVTAYVESGNLQRISLNSGLGGNPQATGNIGGSLDLKLRKTGFDAVPKEVNLSAGVESNGVLQVYGLDAAFSGKRFYTNAGLFYRKAGNYKAGGGDKVKYSQFTKVNFFANIGWKPAFHHIIEATAIYDVATDVGYPALNMDVKRASAIITSISYRQELQNLFHQWETKIYYNRLTHKMDDTHRPDVVIHMDMPGRSSTAGLYSLLQGSAGRHDFLLNYDLYFNTLYADMTMYPKGQAAMFMITWPDVSTLNSGISLADNIRLDSRHHLHFSAKISWQYRNIRSDEGLAALSIYFPAMKRSGRLWQGRVNATYVYDHNGWTLKSGIGYGNRAPTVTEQYGYFLNNTFDNYDYIGNPMLKKESAVEGFLSVGWKGNRFSLKADANSFFFMDYIIGAPDKRLSAMTLGAEGVKIYRNLRGARIFNFSVSGDWKISDCLSWHTDFSYAIGTESTGARLPLIAPLTGKSSLRAILRHLVVEGGVRLATRHTDYSAKYGESPTPGYSVWNLHTQFPVSLGSSILHLRLGVENLFDRNYTTYSDWNHLPQKGRNVFASISLCL